MLAIAHIELTRGHKMPQLMVAVHKSDVFVVHLKLDYPLDGGSQLFGRSVVGRLYNNNRSLCFNNFRALFVI